MYTPRTHYLVHSTITATLRRFSTCDGEVSVSTEHECDDHLFNDNFKSTFYANGNSTENEGYVSIIFEMVQIIFVVFSESATFSCVASVIDAFGRKRFPQSFVFHRDSCSEDIVITSHEFSNTFGYERYLRRTSLLSDPQELLPDDCLTLCLEIDFEIDLVFDPIKLKYDTDGLHKDEDGNQYLRMDTEFARDLCEMSSVFQDMMKFSTDESDSGCIPIPHEEQRSFSLIFRILNETKQFLVTLSDICELYILADKYDMQRIIKTCHQFLIGVIRAINSQKTLHHFKGIHVISELSERFEDDETLRNILTIDSAIISNMETKFDCRKISGDYFSLVKFEHNFKTSGIFK